LIVFTTNIAASGGVYRLLARVAAALAGGDPGPAAHVVNFVGLSSIVQTLNDLPVTLLLHLTAMAKVIVLVHQAETLVRRCRNGQSEKQYDDVDGIHKLFSLLNR
jgi:hypothetical protein